ncbi:MAG: nucleotidyl transferase AbiEii/AbiGii toxin family protein [Elusimicrobia bacterium]|nr:nucleotidyl transferase AbiEii/AbiGii toxin family protein [Elusimicrobiota bacterium]
MEPGDRPSLAFAEHALPAPLLRALGRVFAQRLKGCMLVGGTALAGFYAGHRRSDDIDLFTMGEEAQRAAVLAVRALELDGVRVEPRQDSDVYFRALCGLDGHAFTVDVSAAPAAFRAGGSAELPGGIVVADLDLLLTLKTAALASRCSEKDLYDLAWILERRKTLSLADVVAAACRFDAGADAEGLLISLTGTRPDKEACGFGLRGASKDVVFRKITRFKAALTRGLKVLAKEGPPLPIAELLRRARRLGP